MDAAEAAARGSYGRLLSILAVRTGDLAGAEDALADAFMGNRANRCEGYVSAVLVSSGAPPRGARATGRRLRSLRSSNRMTEDPDIRRFLSGKKRALELAR
jgi:hypothetical protein